MHKNTVVFEIEGGSDKCFGGHRKGTVSIVNAIREAGWSTEVVYYRPEWKDDLYDCISQNFDGYISRANPGSIPDGERGYLELLINLSIAGLVGMSTPGEMMAYSAKDTLVKLKDIDLVPSDIAAYCGVEAFHGTFPISLSYGECVLKQNRGSTGSGIQRVRVADEEVARNVEPGTPLPLDAKLKCTETMGDHTETRGLGGFTDFYDRYITGDSGMFVDIRFMSHVAEGEIRILLIGPHPVFMVHKKPAESDDAFSATLFSDAKYTCNKPEEQQDLIDMFAEARPVIAESLGGDNIPLVWTANFMLVDGEDGEGAYVFGGVSCSCVGFTSELDMGIQKLIAQEAIEHIEIASKQPRQLEKAG